MSSGPRLAPSTIRGGHEGQGTQMLLRIGSSAIETLA
jgi:hypothetical protein